MAVVTVTKSRFTASHLTAGRGLPTIRQRFIRHDRPRHLWHRFKGVLDKSVIREWGWAGAHRCPRADYLRFPNATSAFRKLGIRDPLMGVGFRDW